MTPRVSVVIPTRNAAHLLPEQLAGLSRQVFDGPWEIVIADNGSSDDLPGVVRAARKACGTDIRIVDASRGRGINIARNTGVLASHAPKILLCDADDVAHPHWLRSLSDGLDSADVVGGVVELDLLNPREALARRWAPTTGQLSVDGEEFFIGANIGFRREAWEVIGGFNEAYLLGFCEVDFCVRARNGGLLLRLIPDAIMHYRLRPDARSLRRQRYSYGRGEVQLAGDHPQIAARIPTLSSDVRGLSMAPAWWVFHRWIRRDPAAFVMIDAAQNLGRTSARMRRLATRMHTQSKLSSVAK